MHTASFAHRDLKPQVNFWVQAKFQSIITKFDTV
jgi:hypothetical protein